MPKGTCSIDGCDCTEFAKGWCSKHYTRWRRNGDPLKLGHPRVDGTPEERFWAKVDKTGDCWVWTASLNHAGYGMFRNDKGRTSLAHRFSYEMNVGSIPDGLHACHHCDNPKCVRPSHLFIGTVADNMRDRAVKMRGTSLTASDVDAIREAIASGATAPAISEALGVSVNTVYNIRQGRGFRHLTP